MRCLKVTAARALARAALFLEADASREEFEEYVSDPDLRGGCQAFRWIELVTETGVYATTGDAVNALVALCRQEDPSYMWGDAGPGGATSIAVMVWDAWCFCVARWARHNDLSMASRLPMSAPLDHRHAYATTGPSCDAARMSEFIESAKHLVPDDWLETLVRPGLWHRGAFTLWALSVANSERVRARMLNDAMAAASRHGNLEAVRQIIRVADGDPEIKSRFWNMAELTKTYRLVIDSLL